MGPDGSLQVLLVSTSAELVQRTSAALRAQLSVPDASVCASLAELAAQGPVAGVVILDLRVCEQGPQPCVAALRELVPTAAILVLTPRGFATPPPPGADCVIELDHATSSDQRLLADAVRNAVSHQRTRAEAVRFRALALSLLEATGQTSAVTDGEGQVVASNQRWAELVSGSPDLLAGADVVKGLGQVLSGQLARFVLDHPAGVAPFRLVATPLTGTPGALLTHLDLGAATRTSEPSTLTDALTELPNRRLLHDRLTQALALAGQVAVALFDLDQFKAVNATWGHAAGDELLRQVARRLGQLVAETDTLSRFADDEFVAVRPGVESVDEAQQWAAQLFTAFDEPFPLDGGASVTLTACVGLYLAPPTDTVNEVLQGLDLAVRAAHNDGRGRTRLYTEDLGRGVLSRLRTERELRDGIAAGQFALHYQPVIDLRQRKVVGVEALLRWEHPDGIRLPDTFIPIAEDSGLIVPLGGWVFGEACGQTIAWSRAGLHLEMAVNLSARQVAHADTIATIAAALAKAGLDPNRLLVEVTESAVVEDAEAAQRALAELAALGVRIAIDDFGTGYSSLLYLKRYPIQALKVDRNFVSGMGVSDDDDAIVASVISLARAVGAVCIAEGVETDAQHRALLTLGCHYAQGYLFGRPVPATEVPALVEACNQRLQLPVPYESAARARRQLKVSTDIVRRIEELHSDGASLHTIAAALNKEHVATDHGGRWVSATVARVIAAAGRPVG